MRTMGISKDSKSILCTICFFCENADISNKVSCAGAFLPDDECPHFKEVADVSKRVDELFIKLTGEGAD